MGLRAWVRKILRVLRFAIFLIVLAILISGSAAPPGDKVDRVRAFSRDIEFDYVGWTLGALGVKLNQLSLGTSQYLSPDARYKAVLAYRELVSEIQQGEARAAEIYADPNVKDPQAASADLRQQLDELRARREKLGPLAESIVQSQIARVVDEIGLTLGGQPVPPVLYHSTPLPYALIVSPRDAIRQDADISLLPDLTIDQQVALEERVDRGLNVSSLVVPIGGVGVYPTMVQQTSDLNWLSEVVAHEWVHNFLTLRPLGINYMTSPELRTINETTASIAGKEIGRMVIEQFYPELAPPPPQPAATPPPKAEPAPSEPPAFDFRAEMHETRLKVDELLAEGKIEQAEAYMEERRVFLWEHGYRIRKLNQAYFAFYGAYADQPGGAAGRDPVGEAVRQLRLQSASLTDFLNRISWIASFEQLQALVQETK